MTMHLVAALLSAFLGGMGVGLLVSAMTLRHSYRTPDRRHSLLTRRRWRDLPPFITKE